MDKPILNFEIFDLPFFIETKDHPLEDVSDDEVEEEVLEEKGIKQTWLADKLGKSFNTVNSYVQNRQQPRLEVLNEIADILDVDIKSLIISNK